MIEKKEVYEYDNLIREGLNQKGKSYLVGEAIRGFLKYYNKGISTKYLKSFLPSFLEQNKILIEKGKKPITFKVYKAKKSQKIKDFIYKNGFKTRKILNYHREKNFVEQNSSYIIYSYDKNGKVYIKDTKKFKVGKEFFQNRQETLYLIE